VIEKVSQHPILAIAMDYGRIHTQGQWYLYDHESDCLIPIDSTLQQASLLSDQDQQEDSELGGDREYPF
jgi:hypothetical protein